MGRLTGLGSFALIAAAMLLGLRVLHVGIPLFFPETRPGPFALSSLDDVRRRVVLSPQPTFVIAWRGEHYLSVTQRRGGAMPAHPATAEPLLEVPDSTWWRDGPRLHLVLKRDEFWVEVDTDLPSRDLKRIADTLTPY
jgi:hypothetical protein